MTIGAKVPQKKLRIDILGGDLRGMRIKPLPLEGVEIDGPRTVEYNSLKVVGEAGLYLIIKIGGDVVSKVAAGWVHDLVKNYRAKRVKINGREPADEADFKRIICEEIEIGKND